MKKRIAAVSMILLLTIALGGVTVLAAGAGYVDADGDGVCDNLKLRGANGRHGREK